MFRNFTKEKELVDREIELYKSEVKLKADQELQKFIEQRNEKMKEFAIMCYRQLGEYEHEFHSTKEKGGIELAKLEAKAEILDQVVNAKQSLIDSKNDEIQRLTELFNNLISNSASTIISQ